MLQRYDFFFKCARKKYKLKEKTCIFQKNYVTLQHITEI